jgi:N-acetylglutamate synthase-like GNAT family acetyltransferase
MTWDLRPARREDARRIRWLVWRVRINPTGLAWHRFLLAVDEKDRLVGCGQIKLRKDGLRELASIAVKPRWRRRGIATAMIRQLLNQYHEPLYLTCRAELESFYAAFGFRTLLLEQMPPGFQRLSRLAGFLQRLLRSPRGMLVMFRPGKDGL